MPYTDKELKEATQVAYLDCIERAYKNFKADGKEGSYTLRELITSVVDIYSLRDELRLEGKPSNSLSLQELMQYSDLTDRDKEIIANLTDEMLEWKLVDIHDMNHENGFYGCVIETSPEEAIVAFRGSEGFKKYDGLVRDWMQADFGLLNSEETKQEAETEKYADKLIEEGTLDKYKTLAATGHSLGGHLASHFAVVNAADEKRKSTFDKLDQVVNFDGPGVSDEYIKKFEPAIEKASSKVTHYKWSPIGNVLYDLPGENVEFLQIDEEQEKESLLERMKYKTFWRHHTNSIMFDEDGKAERGEQDSFSKKFQDISRLAEKIPAVLTQESNYLIMSIFNKVAYEKDNGDVAIKSPLTFLKESMEGLVSKAKSIGKEGYIDFVNAASQNKEYLMNGLKNLERDAFGKNDQSINYNNLAMER